MDTSDRIYLDYAATTPVDQRVMNAMSPYFDEIFGNPSSIHLFGQRAEAALENSRIEVANCLNCSPNEIIFTSCGTEADNLALRGTALAMQRKTGADRILISPVEHHAVSRTATQLEDFFGFSVEYLPVDSFGVVDPEVILKRLDQRTALVSVIYANNEIGTINPINDIAAICARSSVPFHTDAVQAAAHLPINLEESQINLMAIGAHKFYGPKGVGVLYIREGTPIMPVLTGGGHEFGLRSGTPNIPYIVGLTKALKLVQEESGDRKNHLMPMRDRIISTILEEISDVQLTGHPYARLPNHASFVFKGVDGNELLILLDASGFACSSGSACKTGNPEPSGVLAAIGLSREWALGSLRVTLGTHTTPAQVDTFLKILPEMVKQCRRNRL
jgi:cysteine desulfurase